MLLKLSWQWGVSHTELEPNGTQASIYTYSGQILNLFSNNFYIPNVIGEGNGVGYGKVSSSEIYINSQVPNGKIIRNYVNNPDIMHQLSYGEQIDIVPTYHKGFENGTLLSEEYYKNSTLQKKISFNYQISNPTNIIEYNSRVSYLGRWGVDCGYDQLQVCYYPIFKPQTLLSEKISEEYFLGNNFTERETYFYNSNNFLNYKSIEPASINHSFEEKYYYPNDIFNSSQYNQITKDIMSKLIEQNRINEHVKIETSIRTKGQLTTKTTYVEYENGNRYLPLNFYSALGVNPLLCDLSVKYNSKSNIIEKTDKNFLVTSYVWSYNNQYPIAEIKNASFQQVSNAVPEFLSYIEGSANPSDLMLNSLFSSLRSALPNAQITTYTYKPLVGIHTATDPRGVTTYYEYDEFNRLKFTYIFENGIKKILQRYDYRYKNQQ